MTVYTLSAKNSIEIVLSLTIFQIIVFFAFYTVIHNGHQQWPENELWKNSADDSGYILRVTNFVEITLMSNPFLDKCVFAFYAAIQDGR